LAACLSINKTTINFTNHYQNSTFKKRFIKRSRKLSLSILERQLKIFGVIAKVLAIIARLAVCANK